MPPKKNNKQKKKNKNKNNNNNNNASANNEELTSTKSNTGVEGAENFGISYDEKGDIEVSALYLAVLAKNTANSIFITKNYPQACQAYLNVLNLLGPKETSKEADSLRVDVMSNLAACFLEMEDYGQTIACCNAVLAKDPNHMKAFFRRALALNRVSITKRMMLPGYQSDLYQADLDLSKAATLYKKQYGVVDPSITREIATVRYRRDIVDSLSEKKEDESKLKTCFSVERPDSINMLTRKFKEQEGGDATIPRYINTGVPGLFVAHDVLTKKEQELMVEICEQLKKSCQTSDIDISHKGKYKHDRLITYMSDLVFAQNYHAFKQIESQLVGIAMARPFIDLETTLIAINYYRAGEGLEPHTDSKGLSGEQVVGFSLLAPVVMTFEHTQTKEKHEVLLPPGSAMIQSGEARYLWKHGFEESDPNTPILYKDQTFPRGYRVSLTFSVMDEQALKRVQEEDKKRIEENGGVAEMIQVTERGTRVVLVQAEGPIASSPTTSTDDDKDASTNPV